MTKRVAQAHVMIVVVAVAILRLVHNSASSVRCVVKHSFSILSSAATVYQDGDKLTCDLYIFRRLEIPRQPMKALKGFMLLQHIGTPNFSD
jgi:hypothetical protein